MKHERRSKAVTTMMRPCRKQVRNKKIRASSLSLVSLSVTIKQKAKKEQSKAKNKN